MKISIIVPVYNVYDYIEKCLKSLTEQKCDNYEIIIVDDGSTDKSIELIKKYKNKYPKLISVYQKENGGLSSARNYGLSKAKGEYVLFVDSDDYLEANALEKINKIINKKKYDIIIFDINKVYSDKIVIRKTNDTRIKNKLNMFITGDPSACNKVFKKSLFTDNNIKFMENIFYEDLATIPLIGLYTKEKNVFYLEEPLYNYVQRNNSIINNKNYNKKMSTIFVALQRLSNEYDGKFNKELEYLYIVHLLRTATMRFIFYKEARKELEKINLIIKERYPDFKDNYYYKMSGFKMKLVCFLAYHNMYFFLKLLTKITR